MCPGNTRRNSYLDAIRVLSDQTRSHPVSNVTRLQVCGPHQCNQPQLRWQPGGCGWQRRCVRRVDSVYTHAYIHTRPHLSHFCPLLRLLPHTHTHTHTHTHIYLHMHYNVPATFSVLKICSVSDERLDEFINLRVGKTNLTFSSTDVAWHPLASCRHLMVRAWVVRRLCMCVCLCACGGVRAGAVSPTPFAALPP